MLGLQSSNTGCSQISAIIVPTNTEACFVLVRSWDGTIVGSMVKQSEGTAEKKRRKEKPVQS